MTPDLPHNPEAEAGLISCCLLDEGAAMLRALEADTRPDAFYSDAHRIAFQAMTDIWETHHAVDGFTLRAELIKRREFEACGGDAFILSITNNQPTTMRVSQFVAEVNDLATRRSLIRLSNQTIAHAMESDDPSLALLDSLEAQLSAIRNRVATNVQLRSLTDFTLPKEDGPDELLGENRYIGRGDSALIVSSSGMGKSSLSMIWAAHIALGRTFLGITTKRPSTSLFIQAEDSNGDIGELWFSIRHTMKLTKEEMALVQRRVIIVRDKVNRGEKFISAMRSLIARVKPDFVWLNPLHSYAGCDIANAEQIGQFLREGLNKANRDEHYAYMIVHHTPKPMSGKGVQDKKWHEFMYDAAGSAELVNWARAVITLKPTDVEGDFNMVLAKRGKRAGVKIEVKGEASTFLQVTTKVPIRQSSKVVTIEGRTRPFHILDWTMREPDVEEPTKKGAKHSNPASFAPKYPDAEVLTYFPSSKEEGESFGEIQRHLMNGNGMSKNALTSRRLKLMEDGYIEQREELGYRRTPKGDLKAKEFNRGGVPPTKPAETVADEVQADIFES